jgi:hypothetical protein
MLKKRFNSPNLNISNNNEKEHNGAIGLCIFHRTTYHTIKQWKDKNHTKSKEQWTHCFLTK